MKKCASLPLIHASHHPAWNHKDITITLATAILRPKSAGFLPLNKNRYLKSGVQETSFLDYGP